MSMKPRVGQLMRTGWGPIVILVCGVAVAVGAWWSSSEKGAPETAATRERGGRGTAAPAAMPMVYDVSDAGSEMLRSAEARRLSWHGTSAPLSDRHIWQPGGGSHGGGDAEVVEALRAELTEARNVGDHDRAAFLLRALEGIRAVGDGVPMGSESTREGAPAAEARLDRE